MLFKLHLQNYIHVVKCKQTTVDQYTKIKAVIFYRSMIPNSQQLKHQIFTGHTDLIVYNLANIIMILQASCCGPLTEQSCSCLRIWSCWSAAFSSTSPLAEVRKKKTPACRQEQSDSEEGRKRRGGEREGEPARGRAVWRTKPAYLVLSLTLTCCLHLFLLLLSPAAAINAVWEPHVNRVALDFWNTLMV